MQNNIIKKFNFGHLFFSFTKMRSNYQINSKFDDNFFIGLTYKNLEPNKKVIRIMIRYSPEKMFSH